MYYQALAMCLPVIVIVVILLAHGCMKKEKIFFNAALAVTYLTLPTITTALFQIFPCDTFDNGMVKLRANLSISCNGGEREIWKIFGMFMILIFPVGVTLTYFVTLWRKRERLKRPNEERVEDEEILWCVFLWEPYRPEYWYWEVIETGRRLAMTGLLSTVDPGTLTQLSAGLTMAILSTIALTWARPFEELRDNVIAALSGVVLVLTFIAAILDKSMKMIESDYETTG